MSDTAPPIHPLSVSGGRPTYTKGGSSSKRLWKQFSGDTLTSARMNTVAGSERSLDVTGGDGIFTASPNTATNTTDYQLKEEEEEEKDNWTVASSFAEEYLPTDGSLGSAIFGIIKGTVGPAVLYLPRGFQLSGYMTAIISMAMATLLYIYNAHRLLACWKVESEKTVGDLLSYPELARRAFGASSIFYWLVNLGIASLQFGVTLTYLIFVPHNLFECTYALTGVAVRKEYFLVGMILVEIPLCWIRDIRKLTPTNVFATALIVYGLACVILLAFVQGMGFVEVEDDGERVFRDNLSKLPAITDSWFLFVGTSFFMMEGSITLLVPLQESIQRLDDQRCFPQTNQTVTSAIVIFYVLFSIICCGAFGDSIQTALTASLDGILAITIQLAYSVAVILTFPLQAFPAMDVLYNQFLGGSDSDQSMIVKRRILSSLVICTLGIIAVYAIDYLGNVVSILGSLFGIPLALVFPPLMHNILTECTGRTKMMNIGVVAIGFLAMGAASFATIISWEDGAEVRR